MPALRPALARAARAPSPDAGGGEASMTAIFSLLVVLTISFLITRLGTAALTLTGVSHELARLQAVSAFTGVGFTTTESELIVEHSVRRRILIAEGFY